MIPRLILALATLLAAGQALAQDGETSSPRLAAYERCIETVSRDAVQAEQLARQWLEAGGGSLASHCLGMAYIGQDRPAEAARQFETAAYVTDGPGMISRPAIRAEMLGHAGNAWLLADDAGAAERDFTEALNLGGDALDAMAQAQLQLDRARARAVLAQWPGAVADLEAASDVLDTDSGIWLLLATARRKAGDTEAAQVAIARAIGLAGDLPPFLLEQGLIFHAEGLTAQARQAWQKAADADPDGPDGRAAQANLAATAGN